MWTSPPGLSTRCNSATARNVAMDFLRDRHRKDKRKNSRAKNADPADGHPKALTMPILLTARKMTLARPINCKTTNGLAPL